MKNLKIQLAVFATAAVFAASCEKEDVKIVPDASLADNSEIVASTQPFYITENGKQLSEDDFNALTANNPQLKNSNVSTGWKWVPRDLVAARARAEGYHGADGQVDWCKNRFAAVFGKTKDRPHGVSFGNHQFGGGTNASPSSGWYTKVHYKADKKGKVSKPNYTPWESVASQEIRATKRKGKKIPQGFDLGFIEYKNFSEVTKTNTHGVDIGIYFEIGFESISKVGGSINYSFTNSKSVMKGDEVNKRLTPKVVSDIWVPKGKKCFIHLQERRVSKYQHYKITTWFSGRVGANYIKRVDNHHFWSIPTKNFFYNAHNKFHDAKFYVNYPSYRYVLKNCRKL